MDTTTRDLDNLMNYVLDQAPPHIRGYLVYRLQHVAALDQQWGVWGAGPGNHPGNKDGWEQDPNGVGVWITNTVGFAGPHHGTPWPSRTAWAASGNRQRRVQFGTDQLTQITAVLTPPRRHPAPAALRRSVLPRATLR